MPLLQRDRSHTATPSTAPVALDANEAFSSLFHTYFDPIYWYCLSRLGDPVAAEDATSTIFSRALAAGPRYEDPSLRSWLFSIAHNVICNVYRGRRLETPLDEATSLPDPMALPEEMAIAADERDQLLAALHQLPSDQRRVVELRMAGLTGPEIARLLDRSHGSVKMLQLRAFTRLRALLEDGGLEQEGGRRG